MLDVGEHASHNLISKPTPYAVLAFDPDKIPFPVRQPALLYAHTFG